jgi:hypothetical protein
MKRKLPSRRWLRLPRLRSNRARALVISAVFAVVMSVGVFAAKEPVGFTDWKSTGHGNGKGIQVDKAQGLVGASSLAPDDPVLNFDKTKVGQVMISSAHNDNCRRVLFDNRTGARLEAGEVFCGQTPEQPADAESSKRMQSLKKAFQR